MIEPIVYLRFLRFNAIIIFGLVYYAVVFPRCKLMNKIRYFAYYATSDNNQNRKYYLSATNKIDYICDTLTDLGFTVELISASNTKDKKKHYKGSYTEISHNRFLKLFYTFPWGNKFQRLMSSVSMRLFIFLELLRIKKGEKVIVYHSLSYMKAVKAAHKMKKFYLILEVEEVYSDIIVDEAERKKEVDYLTQADAFIFPTELLNREVNSHDKPYIIVNGIYKNEPKREGCVFDNLDPVSGKRTIHCVYAGTFEPRKGGPVAAEAARYLPANYHIHIIGFGSTEDTDRIIRVINDSSDGNSANVTYDGMLTGDEYIRFIQSCDIGLSPQDVDASFNQTSFPSKILSYMSNGLRVVSVRIPAIEESSVGGIIYYYDDQNAECIAEAILSVDINDDYDCGLVIDSLNRKFISELRDMLSLS